MRKKRDIKECLSKAEAYIEGYQQGGADAIDKVIKGLMALKERNYDTYYIDAELEFLEQLKEEKK